MTITFRLLFFSLLRDIAGTEETTYSLPAGATVEDLLVSLYEKWPGLKEWDGKVRVAADLEYVERETVLKDGQEVAVMPPVQGG